MRNVAHTKKKLKYKTRDSYLSSVDELISQALSNGLDVSKRSLAGTSAQQPDGLEKEKTKMI
jgi:hypothetical protein